MDLAVAVLAAGASSRMRGGDKLLETLGGVPLLRVIAERATTLGAPVMVTLPPEGAARRAALAGLDVERVTVSHAGEGMAASFRAVAGLAGAARGLLVVLGDMPEITAADMATVAEAWRDAGRERVARAAGADGRPGQPVLFPARLFPALARLSGDTGARAVLRGEDVVIVPLPGERALVDLDTPEAWAAWRKRTGTGA